MSKLLVQIAGCAVAVAGIAAVSVPLALIVGGLGTALVIEVRG